MNNRPLVLSYFNNAGPIDQGEVPNLPDTPSKKTRKRDPLVGIVKNLNARRDMNVTHDFDFWVARDYELEEDTPFAGMPKKDFTNEDDAALYQYDDYTGNGNWDGSEFYMGSADESALFGNLFKKVGHAIGDVGKGIGHAAGSVAHALEHAHDVVGKDIGKAAKSTVHGLEHAHDVVGKDIGHAAKWTVHEGVHLHKLAENETKRIWHAASPYWKYLADAALVAGTVALAATGVGIPAAIALGGLAFSELQQIPGGYGPGPEWVPQLGGGNFGEGGGPGGGDEGLDEEDDTGDTGEGLTVADQQQAAEMMDQQAMADAAAAGKKKNLMLWGGAIVAVIVVIWFIRRK